MRREPPRRPADYLPIAVPAAVLAVFFLVPFGIMVAVSFFRRVQGGFYEPDFVLANYARFLTPFFGRVLGFSMLLALLVAVLAVALALPFARRLARHSHRAQVVWLVGLLSVLSLSEVLIGFAWSTLLSKTAGITNVLVALGLMAEPMSLAPSFGAVLAGMVYQAFPYAALVLYPSLVRLDPSLEEAARTLGAPPLKAFLTVAVPALRGPIASTTILVFVFALGSYLIPQMLGRPQHWTLSVLVTDQAIYQSNMPFAAAMAVFMVLACLSLIALSGFLARRTGDRP
ncbi:ABC transporter permease [Oharaeibacter diazotrophicus]|uniref:Putative spermidine/putrescine transport system permease protein n=1 Tax=Oharaeibacter diazotrophicus TaxID=1920512 RepID=A0A4R6R7K4_9HYPH|nr:ABC transporter permease [Oharaeibacter diazotrophicus]TDP81824.1 putative spermidine/putrescine transport system permease protein [Oharaeibacter diazotrophicus]BBE73456.1 spermidine/putrescine transport system permease protein PotB [Pleomorphomonas sp. SM30]GLS75246.1 ABC transporter permease [Oharaeibacter diazotrophicus]